MRVTLDVDDVNADLVPALPYHDLPPRVMRGAGALTAGLIADRAWRDVCFRGASVAATRADLWTRPDREMILCSFDRMLLQCLADCGPRRAELTP